MSKLSWGKPRIFIKEIGSSSNKWSELNTPIQDTTELQTTKGDKLEAPVEGGQNEDVKHKASTYSVVYNIRKVKDRKVPIPHTNGVCSKHYAFMLMPEDPTNVGFYIEESSVSVDDAYSPADGAAWNIQHDAIASKAWNTVKWGTVEITSEGKLKFTETQTAEGQSESTTLEEEVVQLS